jgi:signal transduction histidine kinase
MSRIVSGKIRLDVQRVDLASIVEAAVDSVRPSAEAKHIQMRTVIDPHGYAELTSANTFTNGNYNASAGDHGSRDSPRRQLSAVRLWLVSRHGLGVSSKLLAAKS